MSPLHDGCLHVAVRVQVVAKGMIARGKGGAIVNVSSVASLVALNQHTSYCESLFHHLVLVTLSMML